MVELPLTQGQKAIVDDSDAHLSAWKWAAHYDPKKRGFYVYRTLYLGGGRTAARNVSVTLHQAILGAPLNRRLQIDHINGNGLDNRRNNLRIVTPRSNQGNQLRKVGGGTTSPFVGVCRFYRGGWKSQIKIDGKQKHLGVFSTAEAASAAYQKALAEINGGSL